jgi:hypothetical protein
MKTEKPLSNKERRNLGSLLRKKLTELGVKDIIMMKATKKVRQQLFVENGQVMIKNVPSLQAHNLNRSMVKRFLSMSRKEIKQFLTTSYNDMVAATKKADAEKATVSEAVQKAAE